MVRRRIPIAFGALVLCLPIAAEAGHGHGHGHWHVDFFYGGGYYRPWCGPYYYYPPPVVYAPAPVVVAPVPATMPVVAAPSAVSRPAATSDYRGGGVTIRNPAASGADLAFVVDGRTEAELKPGEVLPLRDKGRYVVEFDRGGDFGTTKQTLDEGVYEFVGTVNGWDLRRPSPRGADSTPKPVVRRNALPPVIQR